MHLPVVERPSHMALFQWLYKMPVSGQQELRVFLGAPSTLGDGWRGWVVTYGAWVKPGGRGGGIGEALGARALAKRLLQEAVREQLP